MEWSDELVEKLTKLWEKGLSTAEIGRQLSITKNAVVGKAHRIGLPGRPSPIRRKKKAAAAAPKEEAKATTAKAAPKKRKAKSTATTKAPAAKKAPAKAKKEEKAAPKPVKAAAAPPKAKKAAVAEKEEAPKKATKATAATKKPAAPKEDVVVKAPKKTSTAKTKLKERPPINQGPRMTCEWPFGDPGDEDFHFCGARSLPGKPYCEEHARIAYVRLRDKKESKSSS